MGKRIDKGKRFGEVGMGGADRLVAPLTSDKIDHLEAVGAGGEVEGERCFLRHAAELAAINEIQATLSSKMVFTEMINIVGDKISAIFKTQELSIRLIDPVSNMISLFSSSGNSSAF